MRIARTLVLALATALAAMAMAATTAGAQTIEASNEASGEHCDVQAQNCYIQAHSETPTEVHGHAFGFEAQQSRCNDEFGGFLHEDGSGDIPLRTLTDPGTGECTKEPCEPEWDVTGLTEVGAAPEEFEMEIRFCLQDIGDPTSAQHCTIDVHVEQMDHHNAEFRAVDEPCHGTGEDAGEVTGHWIVEASQSDEIQIAHTTP